MPNSAAYARKQRQPHLRVVPTRHALTAARCAISKGQGGHSDRVAVAGNIVPLAGEIFHDDRKPLARWFTAEQQACEEAEMYALLLKGCLLEGWPGWY